MSGQPTLLPKGRQFALTWGLTREFGGMTSALLRRSRAFAELAGTPVDILTFDPRDDYPAIEGDLRETGQLAPAVTVRNMWDELTAATDRPSAPAGAKPAALARFAPLPATGGRTVLRHAHDGTLLQLDRRREDGSLALSDRRDTHAHGSLGGRSIVLCDAAGRPVFGFTRPWPFYHWWLDTVIGDEDSFLIVDSKTTANFLVDYRNPKATRVHVMHNSHLAGDRRPGERVKGSRRQVLARLDDFDAVALLSERQRDDVRALLGPSTALQVVSNAAPLPASPAPTEHDPLLGVMLGSLDGRKRIGHAVHAVQAVRSRGIGVRLDIYGEGPDRPSLERTIGELGLGEVVRLKGFDRSAVSSFATASFFLLTSTSEGFPLVLAEGMARGALPLSYDVAYGPADMIGDGVNGFLVPPGDIAALADAIERLVALPAEEVLAMRSAAMRAASRFSDAAVTARWGEVLRQARARHDEPGPAFALRAHSATLERSGDGITVTADFSLTGADVSPDGVTAAIALHGPTGEPSGIELRAAGSVRRTLRRRVWRARAEFPAVDWFPADAALTGDLELRIGGSLRRAPLSLHS